MLLLIREVCRRPVRTVRKSPLPAYLGMASSSFAASCNARRRLASDLSVAMAEDPTPTPRSFTKLSRKLRALEVCYMTLVGDSLFQCDVKV